MKDILGAAKKPTDLVGLGDLDVAEPGATLVTLATAKPAGGERQARIIDGADPAAAASELVDALRRAGEL
jgi:electron transfer flavoprotein beta subunit